MKFSDVLVGGFFFEGATGEYHKKIDDSTSVVIDDPSFENPHEYYECQFKPDHVVEKVEN